MEEERQLRDSDLFLSDGAIFRDESGDSSVNDGSLSVSEQEYLETESGVESSSDGDRELWQHFFASEYMTLDLTPEQLQETLKYFSKYLVF